MGQGSSSVIQADWLKTFEVDVMMTSGFVGNGFMLGKRSFSLFENIFYVVKTKGPCPGHGVINYTISEVLHKGLGLVFSVLPEGNSYYRLNCDPVSTVSNL